MGLQGCPVRDKQEREHVVSSEYPHFWPPSTPPYFYPRTGKKKKQVWIGNKVMYQT
jgi:hypothetical protein